MLLNTLFITLGPVFIAFKLERLPVTHQPKKLQSHFLEKFFFPSCPLRINYVRMLAMKEAGKTHVANSSRLSYVRGINNRLYKFNQNLFRSCKVFSDEQSIHAKRS